MSDPDASPYVAPPAPGHPRACMLGCWGPGKKWRRTARGGGWLTTSPCRLHAYSAPAGAGACERRPGHDSLGRVCVRAGHVGGARVADTLAPAALSRPGDASHELAWACHAMMASAAPESLPCFVCMRHATPLKPDLFECRAPQRGSSPIGCKASSQPQHEQPPSLCGDTPDRACALLGVN
jgi:hypothetical protein